MTKLLIKYAYVGCLVGILLTLQLVFGPFRIYTIDLCLIGLVSAIALGMSENSVNLRFRWQAIDRTVVMIVIVAIVSTMFSESIYRSVAPLCDWFRILLFWFISRAIGNRTVQPEFIASTMVWIVGALVFAGLLEIATGTAYALIGNYFGGGREQDTSLAILATGQAQKRISGTTTNPNIYGQWIVMYGVLAMLQLIHRRRYMYCVGLAVGSIVVILFTAARGNVLSFLFAGLAIVWLTREQFGNLAVRILISIGLILIAGIWLSDKIDVSEGVNVVLDRFNREFGASRIEKSERVIVGKMGLEIVQRGPKNFLIGVGGENFMPAYFQRPASVSQNDPRTGAHNVWLKSAVEYGIFMSILLAVFIFQALGIGRRVARSDHQSTHRVWGQFLLAFLLSYLLISSQLYESALTYHILIPMFSLVGFGVSVGEQYEQQRVLQHFSAQRRFMSARLRPN